MTWQDAIIAFVWGVLLECCGLYWTNWRFWLLLASFTVIRDIDRRRKS